MRDPLGNLPPRVKAPLPGPASARLIDALARTECPAFTARRARRAERAGAPHDPIVWAEARGSNVVDSDGNVFVDLTSGFGAAAVGHGHARVVAAVCAQAERLLHALGDVHPADAKVHLLGRLAALAPWRDARVVLSLNGSDAVETALKTAVVATGRPGVVAFERGYHGLAHGPLAACGFSEELRAPFAAQLSPHVIFAPFPGPEADPAEAIAAVERAWPAEPPGAVLVEPIQGRGGVVVPPPGFLATLADLCRDRGALLVADEIYTGLGRCAARYRSTADGADPDLIVLGKALGGGLPVSACVGRAEVMAAWGTPDQMAIHTGTFYGHPLGCAAALAALDVIDDEGLAERAETTGRSFRMQLETLAERHDAIRGVRGVALMLGVELDHGERTLTVVHRLLELGYLTLPAGPSSEVLQLSPPLDIDPALLDRFVDALDDALLMG